MPTRSGSPASLRPAAAIRGALEFARRRRTNLARRRPRRNHEMTRRIRAFKRWMRLEGIDISDALGLTDAADEGISVTALCRLREAIPKRACLTTRTSGAREMIEAAGYLGISLALMYERALGAASPWHGHLQLLPEQECVPLVWSSQEVDVLLVGSELHQVSWECWV